MTKNNTKPLNWEIIQSVGHKASVNKHFTFTIRGYSHELSFNDHRIGKYPTLEEAQHSAQNYLDSLLEDIAGEDIKEATYWKAAAQELASELEVLRSAAKEEAAQGELL